MDALRVILVFLMILSSFKIQADALEKDAVDKLIWRHERTMEDLAEFILERPSTFIPLVGNDVWHLLEVHLETFLDIHTNSLNAPRKALESWQYPKSLPLLRKYNTSLSQYLVSGTPDDLFSQIAKALSEVNRNQIDILAVLENLNQYEKGVLEDWVTALCFISSRMPDLSEVGRRFEAHILSARSRSPRGTFRIESLRSVPAKAIVSLDHEYRSNNELPLEEQNFGAEFAAKRIKTGLFVRLVSSAHRRVQKSCRAVLGNK